VPLRFQFLHKVVYYMVVNVPFFIIRLIIWHLHDKHVSVFLVKNVLGMGLAVQHLHEVLVEVAQVIKSDVPTDAVAGGRGEAGSTELRQLTTDADKPKPTETVEMADIRPSV